MEDFVLEMVNGKYSNVTLADVQRFKTLYTQRLIKGEYLVALKSGSIGWSDKKPEMAEKQLGEIKQFMDALFTRIQ